MVGNGVLYLNGILYINYGFNKLILDLENISMVYGMFGFYVLGNGVIGMGFFLRFIMS